MNFHRGSCTTNLSPPPTLAILPIPAGFDAFLVGLGLFDPPPLGASVKALGSSIEDRSIDGVRDLAELLEFECVIDGAGASDEGGGGGGGAGAECGGLGAVERDG